MVPYALVGGALSRTRQNAVDNRLGSRAARPSLRPRHRDRRRDGRQRAPGAVTVEATGRPYSAPGAQGYRTPGKAAPAHRRPRGAIYRVTGRSPSGSSLAGRSTNSRLKGQDVKLGPNRARRGFASSPAQAAPLHCSGTSAVETTSECTHPPCPWRHRYRRQRTRFVPSSMPFLARFGLEAHATVRVEEDTGSVPRSPTGSRPLSAIGLRSSDGRLVRTARSHILADFADTRARRKPLKPLRRKRRVFRSTCGDYRVLTTNAHGLRVPRAPGVSCAL